MFHYVQRVILMLRTSSTATIDTAVLYHWSAFSTEYFRKVPFLQASFLRDVFLRTSLGDKIMSCHTRKKYEVMEVGIMYPEETPTTALYPGQVGYVACNMKESSEGADILGALCRQMLTLALKLISATRCTEWARRSSHWLDSNPPRPWYSLGFSPWTHRTF